MWPAATEVDEMSECFTRPQERYFRTGGAALCVPSVASSPRDQLYTESSNHQGTPSRMGAVRQQDTPIMPTSLTDSRQQLYSSAGLTPTNSILKLPLLQHSQVRLDSRLNHVFTRQSLTPRHAGSNGEVSYHPPLDCVVTIDNMTHRLHQQEGPHFRLSDSCRNTPRTGTQGSQSSSSCLTLPVIVHPQNNHRNKFSRYFVKGHHWNDESLPTNNILNTSRMTPRIYDDCSPTVTTQSKDIPDTYRSSSVAHKSPLLLPISTTSDYKKNKTKQKSSKKRRLFPKKGRQSSLQPDT